MKQWHWMLAAALAGVIIGSIVGQAGLYAIFYGAVFGGWLGAGAFGLAAGEITFTARGGRSPKRFVGTSARVVGAIVICVAIGLLRLVHLDPALGDRGKADLVVVKKSASRLLLERDGKELASFKVAFGAHPQGHKQQEGDERTPEGRYVLDSKNARSAFYKSIHVSYPNARDVSSAKARGVAAGGLIMVHGQKNGFGWVSAITQLFNWTDGCIALSNGDMDRVWNAVDVGTPIQIEP